MTLALALLVLASTSPAPVARIASKEAATKPAAASATTTEAGPTVHVRVNGPEGSGSDVSVDVPFAVARALADFAGQKAVETGRIEYDGRNISVSELRAAWLALRAGKGEMTVKKPDQSVKLALVDGLLKLAVTDRPGASDVHVEVPATAIDALLSSPGDSVNVAAALDALGKVRGKDVVRVRDGDTRVRIWID